MSTKIYEGYRLPKSRLNEFLVGVRNEIIHNVAEAIKMWTENLQPNYIENQFQKEKNKHLEPVDNFRYRYFLCVEPMLEESSKSTLEFYFNTDSSFNIWLDDRYAYVIPYTTIKWTRPDWLEDYSYWDNTDKPEDVSTRQWIKRQKKWETVCLSDWNATRLNYTIVDYAEKTGVFEIESALGLWEEA